MANPTVIWLSSFLLSLILAPLLPGIVNKVKAFFAGRRGPNLFQLYFDLAKLLRKEGVFSATAGGFLQVAPPVSLGCLLLAALLLPHGLVRSPLGFGGDAVLFFYLLGMARFITVLGALDTGSSFEGMGASREMQFSALAEGAIFGVIGFIAVFTGRAGFTMLPADGGGEWWSVHAVSLLLAAAAEEDEHTVDGAITGLTGWIDCFEKTRLAGTVFAGGVTAVGDIQKHPALQKAYEIGKHV